MQSLEGYIIVPCKDRNRPENAVVRARIDEATKREAATVLAHMGLSVSDAFRMLLKKVAAEKALPFEPFVPHSLLGRKARLVDGDGPLERTLQGEQGRALREKG